MFDDELIEGYINRINEVLNSIKGTSGKIEESNVVTKVLLTLPKPYMHKRFSIN